MPRSLLVLFVVTFGLAGCVFDVGADPSKVTPPGEEETDAASADVTPEPGDAPAADATLTPDTSTDQDASVAADVGDTHSGADTGDAPEPTGDSGPNPEPDSDTQPVTDGGPNPEPDSGPNPEPDTDPNPEPDSGPTGDSEETPDTAAPPGPMPTRDLWPATFTHTLTGNGLTLQPLGTRHGFSGVLYAPNDTLRLEALP